jgi:hypothetical protein
MFLCWGWLLSRYDFRPVDIPADDLDPRQVAAVESLVSNHSGNTGDGLSAPVVPL